MTGDYNKSIEAYVEYIKTEFELINNYNSTIVYIGFAAFFALATYVKDFGNRKLFIASIIFMSVSIVFFVAHELRRALIFSKHSSNKANAIENLPDKNLLKSVDETYKVTLIRFQKHNQWYFIPSLLSALVAVTLMFINFLIILLK
ncbi:MAG: hypothetical protein GY750_19120 [Lentisphaerae bacterium]|nr:hypothetical protein [Lentisphaerota bacterium]MCP4103510.1 hypothetical protein [Lentisphaerota bacterium]